MNRAECLAKARRAYFSDYNGVRINKDGSLIVEWGGPAYTQEDHLQNKEKGNWFFRMEAQSVPHLIQWLREWYDTPPPQIA